MNATGNRSRQFSADSDREKNGAPYMAACSRSPNPRLSGRENDEGHISILNLRALNGWKYSDLTSGLTQKRRFQKEKSPAVVRRATVVANELMEG
jgi:hypothetical protein